MIRQLQSSGHRQRPAVQGMHAVGIDITGEVGRTAYAADGDHVVVWNLQLDQGFLNRSEHAKIATSGAPVGIDLAFQIGHRQVLGRR